MILFTREMKCFPICCFIEPSQSKQTALIGGVAGAGGFGLVAIVALVVLLVKFRRMQRLQNSKNDERAGYTILLTQVKGKQSSL